MLKSVVTVIASYAVSIILVIGTDPLLSRLFPGDFVEGRAPSNASLLASTGLFIVISIFCAWLCARFAPSRPEVHVLWFLILGEVLGIATTIPNWSRPFPHWYWLSWLLSWPVSCWIGMLIGRSRAERAAAARA